MLLIRKDGLVKIWSLVKSRRRRRQQTALSRFQSTMIQSFQIQVYVLDILHKRATSKSTVTVIIVVVDGVYLLNE